MSSRYFREDMLKDKVIVISGGTKGVGKAVAIEAARFGADVVISGRDEESAKKIVAAIEAEGRKGLFVKIDLRKAEDIERLFDEAMKAFGKIDGFVNYSGTTPAAYITEETPEQLDWVFDLNARAPFLACKYAIRCMQKNENGGSIVLFGSPHAWGGEKDRAAYAVSKGALLTLMEHVAKHYACDKIRCNYLTMGWTPTEGELALRKTQGMNIEQLREFAKPFIPIGRMTEIEDMVPGVLYLLADESGMVTGANLRCTGGMYF